jgi:hypothetical protein
VVDSKMLHGFASSVCIAAIRRFKTVAFGHGLEHAVSVDWLLWRARMGRA